MKRILLLTLVAVLIISSSVIFADNQESIKSLTLQQAIDIALENSQDMQIAELNIEKANIGLKEAKKAQDDLEDFKAMYGTTLDNQLSTKLVKKGYYVKLSESGKLLAEKGKILNEEIIKFSVETNYYDVLFSKENIKVKEQNLERSKKQHDDVVAKFNLGMSTKQEILTAEANLQQANLDLENAKSDYEYKIMNFNQTIGMPLTEEINLTDKLEFEPVEAIDIDEKIAEALENRFDIIQSKENYENEKLEFDLTTSIFSLKTYKGKTALYDKESTYNELVKAENDVKLNVRKAYIDLTKAERGVQAFEKSIESLKEAYRLSTLSYEVGLSTLLDVLNAQKALNDVELAYLQTLYNYNMCKLNFELSYGIGLSGASK